MRPHAIESWHKVMVSGDVSALPKLLHDDAVFHSPVVHTPQMGKAKVMMYLSAAATVFDDTQFTYCLLYTSPSPRDMRRSRMPSSA